MKSIEIDQIKSIVKLVCRQIIQDDNFHRENLHRWHSDILRDIVQELKNLSQTTTKFVVTLIIGERVDSMKESGFHTASACLWDGTCDGCVTVKWENRSVFSIATIFALKS